MIRLPRREKLPIDTVIFTGVTPLEDFKRDRPREYQQLVDSGQLNAYCPSFSCARAPERISVMA